MSELQPLTRPAGFDARPRLRLRARWVLPISGPAIEHGEVVVADGVIERVGAAQDRAGDALDFGDAVLLPGLVNVHTHLDYTVMRGLLEEMEFFPWVRELNARKAALDSLDWEASATWGATEAVAGGVTTIGDCTDSGAAMLGARSLGLRGVIYQEVFGIDEMRSLKEITAELTERIDRLNGEAEGTLLRVGMSPHAPYTVRPALFSELARLADSLQLPICIHAAESQAESELIRSGGGPIAEMFQRRGIVWSPPGCSPVAYLDALGILGPRTLLVHGVQFAAGDRNICAARSVAWAHCPKSNAKLGNGTAPLGFMTRRPALSAASIPEMRFGLGSDSVASNNSMDLFEEMRFAVLAQRASRRRIGALSAPEALYAATLGGASALGLSGAVGSLEPGKRADLCAVRLDGLHMSPAYDPVSALVYSGSAHDVVWTMIDGVVRYDVRRGPMTSERVGLIFGPIRARLDSAADKMRTWRPQQA